MTGEKTRTTPPHSYRTMREWVLSATDTNQVGAIYRRIHDAEWIECQEPKGLESGADTFESLRRLSIPEAYVAVVPGGHVSGEGNRYSAVTTSDHKPIHDACSGEISTEDRNGVSDMESPPSTFIPETVGVLTDRIWWVHPYFHWMFQVLPRLHLLNASGFAIAHYLINARRSPFQYETLATLGLDEASIIEVDDNFNVRARELAVPSIVPVHPPDWVCAFLRRAFLDAPASTAKERLYISRASAPRGRSVVNEDEVFRVLEKYGFREFVPDRVSVAEQAQVFASAEFVIGPHGSALTNLVFCRPETKVIELFAPKYVHPVYWVLSNQCKLDYYYLVGRGDRPPSWSRYPKAPDRFGLDQIDIDADELTDILTIASA